MKYFKYILMLAALVVMSACQSVSLEPTPTTQNRCQLLQRTRFQRRQKHPSPHLNLLRLRPAKCSVMISRLNFSRDWIWINEISENHSLSNKGLRIISDDLCLLGDKTQTNLLMYNAPQDVSFQIETKVTADTTSNFQQASLFLYEDAENYYSVNRGYCDICSTGGDGIYSDYMYRGEINFNFRGVKAETDELYLKLIVDREGKWLINYYAIEPNKWIQLRKVPLLINVNMVGLGSGNCDNGQYDDNLIAFLRLFCNK